MIIKTLNIKLALIAVLFSGFSLFAKEKKPTIITQELIIDAGIEKAWEVLGPQFTDAYKWASTVKTSKGQGEKIKGIYSERVCETSIGTLHEKILTYSPENHVLSYSFEGMPKMVRFAKNTWTLTPIGANKTKLTLVMEIKIGGFMGTLMKPLMKGKMRNTMKHTIQEFKYYIETGNPHPRKVKAIHKLKVKKS